jgi:hypothetical protein
MRLSRLSFSVLFFAASMFPVSRARAAQKEAESKKHDVQKEGDDSSLTERNRERGRRENSDRLRLVSISDSPDPFSPTVAGSLAITAGFEARPTDAGAGNAQNGKTFAIRVTATVSRGGTAVNTVFEEFSFTYPADLPASKYHPVTRALVWSGLDGNDVPFPDGRYTYSIQGTLVRYDIIGNGKTKVHVVATSAALSGAIMVDSTPPHISGFTPVDGVFTNNTLSVVQASAIDQTSGLDAAFTSFKINGQSVSFSYSPVTGIVRHDPQQELADGSYLAALLVADLAGNQAEAEWSFVIDTVPPTVMSTDPLDGAIHAAATIPSIVISFSEPVNTASVESGLAFHDNDVLRGGTFVWLQEGAETDFTPATPIADGHGYYLVLAGDVICDRAGNLLDGNGNGAQDGSPADDYQFGFAAASSNMVTLLKKVSVGDTVDYEDVSRAPVITNAKEQMLAKIADSEFAIYGKANAPGEGAGTTVRAYMAGADGEPVGATLDVYCASIAPTHSVRVKDNPWPFDDVWVTYYDYRSTRPIVIVTNPDIEEGDRGEFYILRASPGTALKMIAEVPAMFAH